MSLRSCRKSELTPFINSPQATMVVPPPPAVPVEQKPRRSTKSEQRSTRLPRRNHPKDDEKSRNTIFVCQWVSSPNSGSCGKAFKGRQVMLTHLDQDHERVKTGNRRHCLWQGCRYGNPDQLLSATTSFNNHVEDVHLKVEGSKRRGERFFLYANCMIEPFA